MAEGTVDKTVVRATPKSPEVVRGLFSALGVTLRTLFKKTQVVQYPHVKEQPHPRARGVIGLQEDNCTACMLCARECPDWCIYIEGHKEKRPPRREGGKPRTVQVLDRFDIDFSLCMFCGICVEVCPFDALHWSPEYEFSELSIGKMLHDKSRLGYWDERRGATPAYEKGSEVKAKK